MSCPAPRRGASHARARRGRASFRQHGQRELDASGGAAVSRLGHSDRMVTEAIRARLDRVAYAHTGFFTPEPAGPLADLPVAHAPEAIARVCSVSGGAKAMKAALTLARHDMLESGQPGRPPGDRAAPKLSRQHAGGASDRRQQGTAQPLRATHDRDLVYRALRCLSRPGRGRGGPWPAHDRRRAGRAGADHGRRARGGPARGPWRAPMSATSAARTCFAASSRPKTAPAAPFPPGRRAHARIEAAAFEAGRLCHPMGGTIDGRQGDQVLLAPPLTPDGTHALEITDKLQFVLTALR
ncbi:aminotransferase class III-fold pyridoxal phosphate-dependent enzyme [Rhodovulum sulfidophilum]|uniref:aminotransferase class III-fold pyridoxal phosphate-dependent enzyme n=1 Tax=Rhodovulum sulfidophilum TaxID=35806 RepID=UPI0009515669|nr:hypothetical protein BV379_07930 [Rhodovulum sulfidophilum]